MDQPTRQTYLTRITLLQKIQRRHDEHAWKEFFSIYRNFVYSVISRMNVPEDDVNDLTQEVFLKLWKRLMLASGKLLKQHSLLVDHLSLPLTTVTANK